MLVASLLLLALRAATPSEAQQNVSAEQFALYGDVLAGKWRADAPQSPRDRQ